MPLPSLTGLRWWSAMLVFGLHAHNFGYIFTAGGSILSRVLNTAVAGGSCGVGVFFVLSGFVLTWAYRPSDRAGGLWWRRLARIYPLHLVTALIAAALAGTFVATLDARDGVANLANLLLVSAWNRDWWQVLDPASWSLVCEAFFYALFPLLIRVLSRRTGPALHRIMGIAAAATALLALVGIFPSFPVDVYSFPLARLPEFVVGMSIALLVRRGAWRGPGLAGALSLWVAAYAASCFLTHGLLPSALTLMPTALVIAAFANADRQGRPSPLRGPLVTRLGEISYAFYLTQLLVIHALYGFTPHNPALLLIVFGVTLGLAWALNVLVERPARTWLLRLATPRARRPAIKEQACVA